MTETTLHQRADTLAALLGHRMGDLYEEQHTLADSTRVALKMHAAATEMCFKALAAERKRCADMVRELAKRGTDVWPDELHETADRMEAE